LAHVHLLIIVIRLIYEKGRLNILLFKISRRLICSYECYPSEYSSPKIPNYQLLSLFPNNN